MKKTVFALSVMGAIAVLSVVSLIYLKGICNKLADGLNTVEKEVRSGNYEKASADSDALYDYYVSKDDALILFLEHNHLEELDETLSRLSPLIKKRDDSEFLAEIEKARSLTKKLFDHELPTLKNIL